MIGSVDLELQLLKISKNVKVFSKFKQKDVHGAH